MSSPAATTVPKVELRCSYCRDRHADRAPGYLGAVYFRGDGKSLVTCRSRTAIRQPYNDGRGAEHRVDGWHQFICHSCSKHQPRGHAATIMARAEAELERRGSVIYL